MIDETGQQLGIMPPPAALDAQCLSLRKGDSIDLEQLGETLTRLGYERVSAIEQEGSWSRRGDIVDLYPVSAELPVRLEFSLDLVEGQLTQHELFLVSKFQWLLQLLMLLLRDVTTWMNPVVGMYMLLQMVQSERVAILQRQ